MKAPQEKTSKNLQELSVTQPSQVDALFAEVQSRFDAESSKEFIEILWKEFRDEWLGRKSGVLSQITDNWLKPAPSELKRPVGPALNKLRAAFESKIKERRPSIQSSEQQQAPPRDHS